MDLQRRYQRVVLYCHVASCIVSLHTEKMARKKIEIFVDVTTEKELYSIMKSNQNQIICAEIYCDFAGHCSALDNLFQKIKLDWTNGQMVLLRKQKVTTIFKGGNSIKLSELARKEIQYFNDEKKGITHERKVYELNEVTPDEQKWYKQILDERQKEKASWEACRTLRQAARKRHRAIVMIPHLQVLNFVLFWPHSFHAHPELYELWVKNDIAMIGREVIQLTKETAEDMFYEGDASLNEASMKVLLSGPALAICFRLLDQEKHFVSTVRQILYEDVPVYDESKPIEEQPPRVTAFDHYKSFSLSKENILKQRREEKIRKREEVLEKRARRLSEMQRVARQAIDEAIEAKKQAKEQLKLELLRSGNLAELEKVKNEPDDFDDIDIEVPQELPDELEEESGNEEDPDEHFPPAGLLIPGFYSPPNDISKTNGLALLFPKIVQSYTDPPPEYLPQHILIMLSITQRNKAIKLMQPHRNAIIHMGIFKGTNPQNATHVAYSVKQYEEKEEELEINPDDLRLAFMISTEKDLPVLKLMDLHPVYASRDPHVGEEECAVMFSVEYGDEHSEFEDFEDIKTEE